MSIELPDSLPASYVLRDEGIDVRPVDPRKAKRRRLDIALLNLMPRKQATELQFARLLGAAGYPVRLSLLRPASYMAKTEPRAHLERYYQPWTAVRRRRFDGLIVTGAPVETLPFEEVAYWRELTRIFDWAETRVGGSLFVCWAAQAALFHRHGVAKHALPEKAFGVYPQTVRCRTPLLRDLPDAIQMPVSRHTVVRAEELPPGLTVLADDPTAGVALVADPARRSVYCTNHLEYDADTLGWEYRRDCAAGHTPKPPANYYPDDDPARPPQPVWQDAARIFARNWLREVARYAVLAETGDLEAHVSAHPCILGLAPCCCAA